MRSFSWLCSPRPYKPFLKPETRRYTTHTVSTLDRERTALTAALAERASVFEKENSRILKNEDVCNEFAGAADPLMEALNDSMFALLDDAKVRVVARRNGSIYRRELDPTGLFVYVTLTGNGAGKAAGICECSTSVYRSWWRNHRAAQRHSCPCNDSR